ncbi:MAG: CocE/NonD family hydrolase [Chloroflexota bacterium]|nr:CocE/NonD family hydrolase [Chloroflexota bacterium]
MSDKRSLLGVYEGYTEEVADGYERESLYLPMRDGCRIAIDVLHPTNNGHTLEGKTPTVLHTTPYRRSFEISGSAGTAARYAEQLRSMEPGELVTQYEERPIARDLIHHGYRFVSVDIRGTGASFGAEYGDSWLAGQDMAAVIDWICEQPWSSGRVGMVGISYEGMMQFFTAAHRPAGLSCIAPQYPGLPHCYVDGGLAISSFARVWESLHKGMSENEPAAPVDGPNGDRLRAEAESERSPDRYRWVETFSEMDPRDVTRMSSFDGLLRRRPRPDLGLGEVASGWFDSCDLINQSGVPTYIVTGWWDLTFPGYLIDAFNRLDVPKKLIVGPWNHGQGGDPELLRWFDYWLKDIDNGVMDEPPVHYGASKPSGATVWKSAPRLPLPEAGNRTHWLTADGGLSATRVGDAHSLSYEVDHRVSLGELSRHSYYVDDMYINTVDLNARAERCITFTTEPLSHDIEITGWPAVKLDVSTTSDRGAVVVTLEQIGKDGSAAYLSEGFLNFEHRHVRDDPGGHEGPVWHSWSKADLARVNSGETMDVQVEMYPISCIVRTGDRIRLTIAAADADNLIVPTQGDEATLKITIGGERGSKLLLPTVNHALAATARTVEGGFNGEPGGFAFRRPEDPPLVR